MENEITSILGEYFGRIVATVVLLYIFFWWKKRKKKGEQATPDGEQKQASPLTEVANYMKWRFKVAFWVLFVLFIVYLIMNR